jgi:antitoxin component HigA of HigAB toxin-antitoxin module
MKIKTKTDYEEAFKKIDAFIVDNFESNKAKQKEFSKIAKAIETYEKKHYPLLN